MILHFWIYWRLILQVREHFMHILRPKTSPRNQDATVLGIKWFDSSYVKLNQIKFLLLV